VLRRPQAILDLVELADSIAARTSLEAAVRFLNAAEQTMELLSQMPRLGALWESKRQSLAGLRCFPVTRFPNHVVFYKSIKEGVEIVRLLHGARDISALLEPEEEPGSP
jgi:toxin ParE1/3/4